MKKIIYSILFLLFVSSSYAGVLNVAYKGEEIDINVYPRKLTSIIFPEKVVKVVRSENMAHYEIMHDKPNILTIVPYIDKPADCRVYGQKGEIYVLNFHINEKDSQSKVFIEDEGKKVIGQDTVIDFVNNNPPDILVSNKAREKKLPTPQKPVTENDLPKEMDQKITLKGDNLPLKIYLSTIGQATGYNVIMGKDVEEARASINVTDIEIWRGLKSLLYPLSFGFKVVNKDLIVMSKETRVYEISIPAIEQAFNNVTSNESFSSTENSSKDNTSGQTINVGSKILMENKTRLLSLWDDLDKNMQTIVTPQTGSFSINRSTGVVLINDFPGILDKAGAFIDELNRNLTLQQAFEIQIVEVTLKNEFESGVDWNALAGNLKGLSALAGAASFTGDGFAGGQLLKLTGLGPNDDSGTGSSGVSAVLKALEDVGKVEVKSRPHITSRNMSGSIIQEGKTLTYIAENGQVLNDNSSSTLVKTNQVHEGLTMLIFPKIAGKGRETYLNIAATLTTVDSIVNIKTGNIVLQTPKVSSKSITTSVGVTENQSLILGGLISTTVSDSRQGVPVLGAIPVIKYLFSHKIRQNNKKELVIIITPKEVNT
ncbi:MAG: secretin N-terminal domain-containing protein [Candidatus Omnitrophica bacterium]|nr:secretin N-terminal domain-containing protein [Candidatus Omnitrophota bacterium]